jgi:hypothetical protein
MSSDVSIGRVVHDPTASGRDLLTLPPFEYPPPQAPLDGLGINMVIAELTADESGRSV